MDKDIRMSGSSINSKITNSELKVAIVHYWLDGYRGGEKVLEALCEIFPQADIYTHICKPENLPETITRHNITTTFISKLPFANKFSRYFLPLMPLALWLLNLKKYDLIISSESGPAKGVRKRKDALHICYCHSPMRYIWDMEKDYLADIRNRFPWFTAWFFVILWKIIACYMRFYDKSSAKKVDYFVANSKFVSARIRKFYKRKSTVIHPPVSVEKFAPGRKRKNFYLCVSQLVPYKKVDLLIRAFNKLKLPLCIIGDGSDLPRIKNIANDNVEVLGRLSGDLLKEKLETCKAFVYAGKEDFGIVFVEALAAGAPVIAYGKGGVKDIVKDEKNGFFFYKQNRKAVTEAISKFESVNFDYTKVPKNAGNFSKNNFKKKFWSFLESKLNPAK